MTFVGDSYPFAKMQSTYFTAPADGLVLYVGHLVCGGGGLTPLQRCSGSIPADLVDYGKCRNAIL